MEPRRIMKETTKLSDVDNTLQRIGRWDIMMKQPVAVKSTKVLLLSFSPEIDELKTRKEVDELRKVFENDLGFEVVHKEIGAEKPAHNKVNFHLSKFVDDFDHENSLLIIYYAGHGFVDENTQKLKLTSNTSRRTMRNQKEFAHTTIDWNGVEQNIEQAQGSVLVILDCCFAGILCHPKERGNKRQYEILAACGENQMTPWPGEDSFTRALIYALQILCKEQSFSTNQLYQKIREAPNFKNNKSKPEHYASRIEEPSTYQENIVITPNRPCDASVGAAGVDTSVVGLDLETDHFLDLRLYFSQKLDDEILDSTAKSMSVAIARGGLKAKRVSWLRKGSLKSQMAPVANHLRTYKRSQSTTVTCVTHTITDTIESASDSSGDDETIASPQFLSAQSQPLSTRPGHIATTAQHLPAKQGWNSVWKMHSMWNLVFYSSLLIFMFLTAVINRI